MTLWNRLDFRNLLLTLSIISCIPIRLAFSYEKQDKVIYGDDNRLDIYQVSNPRYLELASATAAMVPESSIKEIEGRSGQMKIIGKKLSDRNICPSAKFANQLTAASCSGFLIGPDLLITAGHCIRNLDNCQDNLWVFGFALYSYDDPSFKNRDSDSEADPNDDQNESFKRIAKGNIYKCIDIIDREMDRDSFSDYALIKLDRVVTHTRPLRFRSKGKISNGTPLVIIGHPTGLPAKVADGAWVRSNDNPVFFVANLDSFGGNSGSPVFDANTGIVEGILVRGEMDYVYEREENCRIPKVCLDEECRGEDVTRITKVKKLMDMVENL